MQFKSNAQTKYGNCCRVATPKIKTKRQGKHSVEISNGFGITKDIVFRIGIMNTNATHQKVDLVLRALYEALKTTVNFVAPKTKVYY